MPSPAGDPSCCCPARPGTGKTRLAEDVLAGRRGRDVRPRRGDAGGLAVRADHGRAARLSAHATRGGLDALRPARAAPRAAAARARRRRATSDDRATLFEAIRCGLAAMVSRRPAAMLLDDLQWSDEATLELLAALAPAIARHAAARRRRLPLRRGPARASAAAPAQRPAPRARAGRADARAAQRPRDRAARRSSCSATAPSPRLVGALHDRTGGVPFFVEELTAALRAGERLRRRPRRARARPRRRRPPAPDRPRRRAACRPRRSRDAGAARRGGRGRGGDRRSTSTSSPALGAEDGPGRAARRPASLVETEPGRAAFRHPLARDAIYDDVPWLRRRALHRAARGRARATAVTTARRSPRTGSPRATRPVRSTALLAGDRRARGGPRPSRRDAARAPGARPLAGGRARRRADRGRRAPRAPRGAGRGPRRGGARQREVVARGAPRARAGRWPTPSGASPGSTRCRATAPRALAARRVAAEAYAANGLPGEAAAERLVAAGYLQSAGHHSDGRRDRAARRRRGAPAPSAPTCARGRWGSRASRSVKGGAFDAGIEIIRAGLVAGARARADARGGGGLPAARHRARDRRRLRRARARPSGRRSGCASARRRRAGAGLPELHGLRPARARRLGPGRGALRRADRDRCVAGRDARRRRRPRGGPRCGAADR